MDRFQHWYRQSRLRARYLNRVVRAVFLRVLLRLSLPVFKLEARLAPAPKPGGKRILVIVIGGLGDCLLFDSLFRRIKEQWPGARVDVLSGGFGQMWQSMLSVDNLILFTPTKFKPPWSYLKLFRTLFRNRYDIVAEGLALLPKRGIFPIFTSLVLEASQAPVRIGRKHTGRIGLMRIRELGFIGVEEMRRKAGASVKPNPYLTHELVILPPERRTAHESRYILQPLGLSGDRLPGEPRLAADPPNDSWAMTALELNGESRREPLIGLTLETTRQIKSWPLPHFLEVIQNGIRDGFRFVLIGLDQKLAGRISTRFPGNKVLDLTGRTDLGQMIAIIRHCDVFVSADTGPAHIAQACQVPTIVLFGPSNEKEFGPADTRRHRLILPPEAPDCRPCVLGPCVRGRSCIRSIEPREVYTAIRQKARIGRQNIEQRTFQRRETPQRLLCVI